MTLTLQGVQLEAALDRARGLVVLFQTEVESAGCTLQPSPGSCCAPKPCKLLLLRPRGVAASATLSRRPLPGTLPPAGAVPTAAVEVGFPSTPDKTPRAARTPLAERTRAPRPPTLLAA